MIKGMDAFDEDNVYKGDDESRTAAGERLHQHQSTLPKKMN